MSRSLSKEQIEDLLNYIGVDKVQDWKDTRVQFCCPIHGESNPSCGINIDYVPTNTNEHYQVFHCFSCGEKGSIAWLLYRSLPDQFKNLREAEKFLASRYNIDFSFAFDPSKIDLKRYESFFIDLVKESRHEIPMSTLAPFKSGKETYKYFFKRGFTKEDMKKFMIGRDLENKTVTIPAFWEDGTLAGVIGRYIDPNRPKNMRFKIYSFPKSSLIYPLDKLEVIDDTIIGVESMFDAIMMHKWGYRNTVAVMGDGMSKAQSDMIASRCNKFIALFDNDRGGEIAVNVARKALGKRVLFLTCEYPEFGKDPCEWGEVITNDILLTASFVKKSLPRL